MKKIVFILGPTAIGKTQVAVELARLINAEIISCDSMQVYRGMEIMTAQPAQSELAAIPHYLIAKIEPSEEYSAQKFRDDAVGLIKDISSRKKIPLLVVGTGLYFSALVDGLFKEPKIDPEIRKSLNVRGVGGLYSQLKAVDREAALKIHPNDKRRIVRALEVYQSSGVPISVLRKDTRGLKDDPAWQLLIFGLRRKRKDLYQRIEKRVELMFDAGIIDEVGRLNKKSLSQTAQKALGFSQINRYLEGKCSLEEAIQILKRDTRHYARRQLIWFRADKRINWIDSPGEDAPGDIAAEIKEKI